MTVAYNTGKQRTTGFRPFYLINGREAESTLDTMFLFCPDDVDGDYIAKVIAKVEESRQLARTQTLKAKIKTVYVMTQNTEQYFMLREISCVFIHQSKKS